MSRQAELLPSPLCPSPGCQGCQGIALADLHTSCLSHPGPKLAGLEVPARQPKAVSSGKDVLSRQATREGRQRRSPAAGRAPGSPVLRWSSPCSAPAMACPPPLHFRNQLCWVRAFPLSLSRPTGTMVSHTGQTKHLFMGRASLPLTLTSRAACNGKAGSASCQAASCKSHRRPGRARAQAPTCGRPESKAWKCPRQLNMAAWLVASVPLSPAELCSAYRQVQAAAATQRAEPMAPFPPRSAALTQESKVFLVLLLTKHPGMIQTIQHGRTWSCP